MILVLHRHEVVQKGIAAVLNIDCVCPESMEDAKTLATVTKKVQVIVVEPLHYPQAVKTLSPHAPVVVFTAADGESAVFEATVAGAVAYVSVNEPTQALVEAVRKAREGTPQLSVEVVGDVVRRMTEARQAALDVVLSPQQLKCLVLMAQGLSNQEIGEQLNLSPGTVANYLHHAYERIGVEGHRARLKATLWAQKQGLLSVAS